MQYVVSRRAITSTFRANCDVSDVVGTPVYISGEQNSIPTVSASSYSDITTVPCVGVISNKISNTQCEVTSLGEVEGLVGLVVGDRVFLGESNLSQSIPVPSLSKTKVYFQNLGVALSQDKVYIDVDYSVVARVL